MTQGAGLALLGSWQNFYMIAGTAAATLTGLMFVATTLLAGYERQAATIDAAVSAFHTPTVAHFCAVLLMAGLLSAPWQAFSGVSLLLGFEGVGGVIYLVYAFLRMRNIPDYQTPIRDWLWYIIFPLILYIVLITTAAALPANPAPVLYMVGTVMVVLLAIGIRNAWDLVTFLAIQRSHPENGGHG